MRVGRRHGGFGASENVAYAAESVADCLARRGNQILGRLHWLNGRPARRPDRSFGATHLLELGGGGHLPRAQAQEVGALDWEGPPFRVHREGVLEILESDAIIDPVV